MHSTYSGEYPQSRFASRFPRERTLSFPARILAIPLVTFLVTKVSPRRGDSWLKRIPLHAKIP